MLTNRLSVVYWFLDESFQYEQVEINDYPQHARWKATHKESLSAIVEFCDVCITAKVRVSPSQSESVRVISTLVSITGKVCPSCPPPHHSSPQLTTPPPHHPTTPPPHHPTTPPQLTTPLPQHWQRTCGW